MDNTTAMDGSIEAVAASLISGGQPQEDETVAEELEQSDEDDAQDQTEAEGDDTEETDVAETDADQDEGEADAAEEEQTEQLFTVKVDGRERQVPLDELLRGYSGQTYIQRGMQEVATAKKEVEALYGTLQSERQQLATFMQAAQTGKVPMRQPEPPNEDLLSRDPIGYLEARVKYDKEVAAFQQGQKALEEVNARAAQDQERQHMAYLAEQHQMLTRAIPAFAKPETAAKAKQELFDVGQNAYGFSADELRAVSDSRMVMALHDAAQYRRLMAGKSAPVKQVQGAKTPVIKPGVKMAPQAGKRANTEKAKAQMKRTGSVDDVARFLLM